MTNRELVIADITSHYQRLQGGDLGELPKKPFLFCGPCQMESEEHSLFIAEKVLELCNKHGFQYAFKASFDKANRTSKGSSRGIGIETASRVFEKIQSELDIPTLTDIHSPSHPTELGDAVDIFQIPAFLCRQTDLLVAAGKSGKIINLKKGQFVHPEDLGYAAKKIQGENSNTAILLCERGTCFGYRDLVVDMRGLVQMRQLGYPVIFDGSHVVQIMSVNDGVSGGKPQFTPPLCRAAIATGVDGLFLETHESPKDAPCDGDSMIPLDKLDALLSSLNRMYSVVREQDLSEQYAAV